MNRTARLAKILLAAYDKDDHEFDVPELMNYENSQESEPKIPVNPNQRQLNPEISDFGLFNVRNEMMEDKIGRKVLLNNEDNSFGSSGNLVHEITGVQKLWNGKLGYRAKWIWPNGPEDSFGRALAPEDIKKWLT